MTSGQPSGISHAAAGGTSPAAASGPAKRSGRVPVPGKVDAAGRPVTRLPDGTLLSQRYELSFLAAGGMGAVYRARDRQGGAEVIVKEAFSRNPDDHAMVIVALTQEREALIRLDHHGIVKALDFFIENGAAYLVLEYVKGQTLEALIGAGKPLDEGDAVSIALQVCEVLEHIHSHGLVYRDLKPENIMVGDDGKVKLIDFGTVRLYKSGQRKDTSALGTVGFAPPEQFGHGQTDRRSDVYSLGVSLHYMLTRRHPDEAPFHFPPLRTLNPSASEALEILVARAVQSVADQRFASAAQMREALIATRKVCPVCGTMNRARGKFCIKCGQALPGGSGPVPPPVAVAKPPTVKAPAGLPATTMVAGTAPVAMPTVAGLGATGPVGPASLAPPPAAVAQSQLLTRPALAGGHPPPPLSGPVLPLHPTPGPIKSGRVWRVDLLGRGDFVRISDAVGAARPGDVIEVGPGTYQESLRVDEQLVIKGAGAKLTRVVSAVNRPVLEISSSDGTWVEGMTLEYNGARPNCAVWVKNSKAIVQGCAIHGATLSGVEFGAQSSGEIRCNDISGNHQTGIFIHSRSTVGIFGNHIHDNGLATRTAGIEVREQSHLAIEGNLIGNNGIALYIHGSSNPTVRGNTIVANG
ncbi:MAG: DUF1565 domain-containing protein, partial [Armatimonadetes bacterium]|nr:DUF1565 domain-containing protein [Armatimonadota bacterium]